MNTVVKKNTHVKWNAHDAVCANDVRPIIWSPSLIRSSFSLTTAPIPFATEYITDMTTIIAKAKDALGGRRTFVETRAAGRKTSLTLVGCCIELVAQRYVSDPSLVQSSMNE